MLTNLAHSSAASSSDERLAILIIDDDALDRAAVRRAFRASGLATTLAEAENGDAALALLAQQVFDCILLDYRLPGTDGLAMLHRIRAAGVHTPVIILTGQGDEALAVELMKAGASDYLAKGRVSPDTLASSIHQALRVNRAERERLRTEGRLRLLADMSRMLGASLNYYDNLRNLAAFVVPQLADACAIDVIEQDGQLQRFTMAVSEPLELFYPLPSGEIILDCDAENGSAAVIRSGVTQAILDMQPGQVPDLQLAPHESVDPPALTSMICVPLVVRTKAIGAVSFARYTGRPSYDASDITFAEELARRVALALDNALLYQEAQDAIHTRDAFLTVAAHELKNPLTALLGYAELLQRRIAQHEAPDERERRMAQVLTEQAQRLNKMISSLLDLSRLQTGQFSIERNQLDICALLQRIVDEIRPTLTLHSLSLDMPAEPIRIVGDELRLEQVFQNLITNAIKYSPRGGPIDVHISADGEYVYLNISDQGVGIPKDAQTRIFRRFYRANNSEDYHISGLGVGLYVVKQILEIHGGGVSVESSEGKGSTFHVWLPLVAIAEPELTPC